MRSDDPNFISASLGLIDDDMETMLIPWAEACGQIAEWEQRERMMFLEVKEELRAAGQLTKKAMELETPNVTETAIKDRVQRELHLRFAPEYQEMRALYAAKARGDAMFKGLDARRSIGQSLLKRHTEADRNSGHGHGQGSMPQNP